MNAEIAIVVPALNRVDLLRHCLESIRVAASGLRVEVILVDDGSEPPLTEQLPETVDLSLTVIRQENRGLIEAKNTGFRQVTAPYVLFLDSDDLIHRDTLRVHLDRIHASGADITYTDVQAARFEADRLAFTDVHEIEATTDSLSFFLEVRPPPHAPVYRSEYLRQALQDPLVPPAAQYNSIGEVWMYYNLSLFPAKLEKISGPYAIIPIHSEDRISQKWERLSFAALLLNIDFVHALPVSSEYRAIRQRIGELALHTLRRMPRDVPEVFEKLWYWLWKTAPRGPRSELGGPYFVFATYVFGIVGAVELFRRMKHCTYSEVRTLTDVELSDLNRQLEDAIQRHSINP